MEKDMPRCEYCEAMANYRKKGDRQFRNISSEMIKKRDKGDGVRERYKVFSTPYEAVLESHKERVHKNHDFYLEMYGE